jgi:aspartate kinase
MDAPLVEPGARPIVVQKYGGSSVADVSKLLRVADCVVATRRAGNDVVVVVSAMGKTTDGLVALAAEVAQAARPVEAWQAPRRELDMLVSTGERVAMALLSIAVQARGIDAVSFTGSQSGIITNDRHFDARIIEVRPHRIEDELARGRVVIVAGYQGMSYRREITTLGRGGSDTTAVALAAALGAARCEIYSDVDGVYSADPRAVPDAVHLPDIDHQMLQEMARSGAKVVCAQAVEWARRAGITLLARATFDGPSGRQTSVRPEAPEGAPRARAVVADPRVALLETEASALAELCASLRAADVTAAELCATERGAALVVSLVGVPGWAAVRAALPAGVRVDDAASLVGLVGAGLGDDPDALPRFQGALARASVAARLVLASAVRLAAVVPAGAAIPAQRALHDAFVART